MADVPAHLLHDHDRGKELALVFMMAGRSYQEAEPPKDWQQTFRSHAWKSFSAAQALGIVLG